MCTRTKSGDLKDYLVKMVKMIYKNMFGSDVKQKLVVINNAKQMIMEIMTVIMNKQNNDDKII